MNDIFNESNKVKRNTFRFLNIGDKISGTLIAKRTTVNMLRGGEEQFVYDIKQSDGNVFSVFGKPGIDSQLKSIRLGQVIGLVYERDLAPKIAGHRPTRIIQAFANRDIIDTEWLKEKEEEESISAMESAEVQVDPLGVEEVPFKSGAELKSVTKMELIEQVAMAKLPEATKENWKVKVMETTGLALTSINEDKILSML